MVGWSTLKWLKSNLCGINFQLTMTIATLNIVINVSLYYGVSFDLTNILLKFYLNMWSSFSLMYGITHALIRYFIMVYYVKDL